MTWRLKLAEWLLRDTPYSVVSTSVVCEYVQMVAEEARVRELILTREQLGPVLELLSPKTPGRMH